jgi:hypothetical protein
MLGMDDENCVYVVQGLGARADRLLATFTVKHELQAWLGGIDREMVLITRMPDGDPGRRQAGVELNPRTLEPAI